MEGQRRPVVSKETGSYCPSFTTFVTERSRRELSHRSPHLPFLGSREGKVHPTETPHHRLKRSSWFEVDGWPGDEQLFVR